MLYSSHLYKLYIFIRYNLELNNCQYMNQIIKAHLIIIKVWMKVHLLTYYHFMYLQLFVIHFVAIYLACQDFECMNNLHLEHILFNIFYKSLLAQLRDNYLDSQDKIHHMLYVYRFYNEDNFLSHLFVYITILFIYIYFQFQYNFICITYICYLFLNNNHYQILYIDQLF